MKNILIFISILILLLNFSLGQNSNICSNKTYVDVENPTVLDADSTFESFIKSNIQIPNEYIDTYRNLFFEFVVNSEGNTFELKFINKVFSDSSLVSQLENLISKSKWIPATVLDKKVCQQLKFSLIINKGEIFVPQYAYNVYQKNVLLK